MNVHVPYKTNSKHVIFLGFAVSAETISGAFEGGDVLDDRQG
jgi:hypothetical protein